MANVFDVAAYILKKTGPITAMKLQKLVYYCQAWSLVWDEAPIFGEEIQAWANGPVVPKLFQAHRGKYTVSSFPKGSASNLSSEQKATVDAVLAFYGKKSSQWLSDLYHMEEPWKEARNGIPPTIRGNNVITHASMMEYYSSIPPQP